MIGRIFCAALCAVFASSLAQQPEITTSHGSLKGYVMQTISGREIHAFEGIPFAKPPIGKHRFKQAVPNDPWTGVLNATRLPNMCMQQAIKEFGTGTGDMTDVTGSEDCLYLNVYRPKLTAQRRNDKLLNVIVEIHGGGFQFGFGHMYGPAYLLDRDVILVNFNYRLGLLGFLSFEDAVMPGNNGLKDQVLALQWVNKHIAAFGGDPNKVTIAGMSAGATSVHFQMLSTSSKGLFQKAIANSGSAMNPWLISRNARKTGLIIAESVGCPTNDSLLALKCLRQRTAEQLQSAVVDLFTKNVEYVKLPFAPVIEPPSHNAFMDQHPIDLIISNAGSDIPALFSYAIDEGAGFLVRPFFDIDDVQAYDDAWNVKTPLVVSYAGLLEPDREMEVSQILRKRFLGDDKLIDNLDGYAKLIGERYFDDNIQKCCLLHAKHQKSPVYSYRFSFRRPKGFSSFYDAYLEKIKQKVSGRPTHGEDYLYIFSAPGQSIKDDPEALAMGKTMIDIWFKFIEENPVANWSTVDSKLPQFTFLEITSSKPNENGFQSEETVGAQFWDTLNLPLDPPTKSKSERIATHNEL